MPPGVNPSQRLLAGRGHGARHEAQPDHRCARPAAQRGSTRSRRAARTTTALAVRDPDCRSGFYVISYADPANLRQIGDFVVAARRPHGELHPGLQVRLDRRPGAARRPGQPRPDRSSRRPGQPPSLSNRLVGDGRPIWVTDLRNPAKPRGLRRADRPVAQRRLHGLLARRRRGRAGHRLGRRPRRHARLRHLGQAPRPVPEPRPPGDAVRPDPRRRRRRGVGRPERPGRRRHRAARDADAQLGPPDRRLREGRRASRPATCWSARRRTSRDAERLRRQRPDRAVGHHGLAAAASPPRSRRARSRTG